MREQKMKKTNPSIQQKTEEVLVYLSKIIQGVLNEFFPNTGFALLVFKFNEKGHINYISNAERESMIKALKEIIEQLEENKDFPAGGSSGSVH